MTARDRIVGMVLAAIAVLGAVWLLLVSPERKEASKFEAQVNSARAELSSAESQLTDARNAQSQYSKAYTTIVNLGKAVPTSQEVPSLIYELEAASNLKRVDFVSITSGTGAGGSGSSGSGSGSSGTSSGSGAGTSASSSGGAANAGFSQMPFTFTFEGGFFQLERLFQKLNRFAVRATSGSVQVNGRLLTIQSVKLAPASNAGSGSGSGSSSTSCGCVLTGTVTATAYTLPAGQSLTGGATPSGPAGTTGSTQTASTTSGSGSPATPATVGANP
jgi:hypothetical protein